MLFNPFNKKTYLIKPVKYTMAVRFGSRGPGPGPIKEGGKFLSKGTSPKPLPPSSLKTPGSIEEKSKNYPKPITPKYSYNHNTYVKSTEPPISALNKPNVAWAIKKKQQEHVKSTETEKTKAIVVNQLKISSDSGTSTHTSSTTTPANTTTTTSNSEPLTSSNGALVLYKSPKTSPIQNNLPTIFIDPHGNAMFNVDNNPLSLPIPTPPSLVLKPLVNEKAVDSFLDELLNFQKSIPHPPLEIPEYTLISDLSQEKDKSVIAQKVSQLSKELSDKELMKELAGRGFIKVADDNKTKVKSMSGETIVVGEAKNNIKITPFGKAYVDELEKDMSLLQSSINTGEHPEYKLAVLSIDNNTFLLNGPQKHIVVVYDKGQDIYYGMGYLTSAKGEFFAVQQFKYYQNAREANKDPSTIPLGKPQNINMNKNLISINKNQLIFLKWDQNYFQDMKSNVLPNLNKALGTLKNKPIISYDAKGYLRGTLVGACISFDYHIIKKIPHPKTYVQILSEKENYENKEKQIALKKAKAKEFAHYKKEPTTPFNE